MPATVFDASRYHTDVRSYKVMGGGIPAFALQSANDYLRFLESASLDGRMTEKSYAEFLDATKENIRTSLTQYGVADAVDNVRYNRRFYISDNLPFPAYGHTLDSYKENSLLWVDKCLTLFRTVKAYREDNSGNGQDRSVLDLVGTEWLVTGKGDYVGTFPKRVAKALFKVCRIKLRPEHLQTLGDIVSPHVTKEASELMLAFDQDYAGESDPREYCHADSCWWNDSREGLREGFVAEGGWAIRQFSNGNPISRCWIVWDKKHECYVLFNVYGKTDLPTFARVLSTSWGLSYAQARLYPDRSEYYINGDKCYVVGSTQAVENAEELHVSWHKPIKPKCRCSSCAAEVERDSLFGARNADRRDVRVCSNCYAVCSRCGIRHTTDAMIPGTPYCQSCRPHLRTCGCCGVLTENTYCTSCVQQYNLVDRYEVDWTAMTYRFIPAQLPPTLTTGNTVHGNTASATTVG